MSNPEFFRHGKWLFRVNDITKVDMFNLHDYSIVVSTKLNGPYILKDLDAIELIMLLKPSALEGRKLKTLRHRWLLHNLVGHPLMQLLSLVGLSQLGLKTHDRTTPWPITPSNG
jgi:hypothetical protein